MHHSIAVINQENGVGLTLEITRHCPAPGTNSDRFGHCIKFISSENSVDISPNAVLLSTVEGSDVQPWPPSPPLQDYSIEQRNDKTLLLAVGMAGRSHWSASIAADLKNHCLEFDMACRIKSPPEFIGTTYNLSRSCQIEQISQHQIAISANSQSVNLTIDPAVGNAVFNRDGDDQISIVAECPTFEKESTIRWNYRLDI